MKAKNVSGTIQEVFGVGVIEPNEIVDVPDSFSNPNFEVVQEKTKEKKE